MTKLSIAGCEYFSNIKEKTRLINSVKKKYKDHKVMFSTVGDGILYFSTSIKENDAHRFM
jgi:hypothetical protein